MNAETLKLMHEIDRVFTKYPFSGSLQIAAYLPRNGFHAGRHRVRRLMGIMPCPAGHRKAMSREGAASDLQRAKHEQKTSTTSHLPLSATEAANYAPEPRLVQ